MKSSHSMAHILSNRRIVVGAPAPDMPDRSASDCRVLKICEPITAGLIAPATGQ